MKFPSMVKIKQHFNTHSIGDVSGEVRLAFDKLNPRQVIAPGQRVAIAAGSRGIYKIAQIVGSLVNELKGLNAEPFIVPAMGSHGGATAEGQKKVLEHYGITEESMGVPIKATMEVVQVGETPEGIPVLVDKNAVQADHIVVCNRVKPHTDFEGDIESGIMKMIAIGLGKQKAADRYHNEFMQLDHYHVLTSAARIAIENSPITFGLAVVENQRDETQIIEMMPASKIEETESRLLVEAKKLLPRIPFDSIDLLIVDMMGKNISGTGMDQNIIARTVVSYHNVPSRPEICRIFVRDLSPESGGNAVGIGNADFTLKRLVDKIDRNATYMNAITSSCPDIIRIPPYYDRDRDALAAALQTLPASVSRDARVVRIENTLRLEEMFVSEALIPKALEQKHISVVGTPAAMAFDENGELV